MAAEPAVPQSAPQRSADGNPAGKSESKTTAQNEGGGMPQAVTEPETPSYLRPKMPKMGDDDKNEENYSVREPAIYRSLFILDTLIEPETRPSPLKGPLDPFYDEGAKAPASNAAPPTGGEAAKLPLAVPQDADLKPAVGVLTVHEQTWEQKGLALGNLLQSVCLAPGEVTQVAVTRWERKTTGTGTELTEQAESVSSQMEQNRAVNEVQRAVAQETQWGSSSTAAASTSSRAGVSYGFFGLGASASSATTTSSVLTAQFSAGNRNVAAESTNAISQRTAEHSQALRSRRQSVVREVSEQESESLTTRVLANYNRRHTLNILFFEVLQLYQVCTALKDWERCLFVPMLPVTFTEDTLKKHRVQLLAILSDLGAKDMIDRLGQEQDNAAKAVAEYDSQIKELETPLQLARDYARCFSNLQYWEAEWPHLQSDYKGNPKMLRHKKVAETQLKVNKEILSNTETQWAGLKLKSATLPPLSESTEGILAKMMDDLRLKRAGVRIPIAELMNQHRLFLSQQLWLRMSPYRIFRILQQYEIGGQPLAKLVDPQPVGVFGNYLAFRWGFKDEEELKKFNEQHHFPLEKPKPERSTVVGLPTSGVFAEGVLGKGLAAERVDASFGKWADKDNRIPILPPKIAGLQSRERHHDLDLGAQDFAASLAALRAEKLDDISHIDKLVTAVGKGDMFRDMGGLQQALILAGKLGKLSAAGAKEAAEEAGKLQAKILDTFKDVLNSDIGKAAVAEAMVPGSGAAMLGKPGAPSAKSAPEQPAVEGKEATPAAT